MSEYYMGQITQVGFNFAPKGWALCAGQQLAIQQYNALFALLGTAFGGNGQSTFGLPDARGRVFVGVGNATSGSVYDWGQIAGTENTTLSSLQMPIHNHGATFTPTGGGGPISASGTMQALQVPPPGRGSLTSAPDANSMLANVLEQGGTSAAPVIYAPAGTTGTAVNLGGLSVTVTGGVSGGSVAVANAGGSQPVSLMQPYLAVQTCICLYGLFPSRN